MSLESKNINIQPVLLGGDINCYSVARAFHEAYNVKSIAYGRYFLGATKNSKIIDFRIDKRIDEKEECLKVLLDLKDEYKDTNTKLILMGCTDAYAEFIIDNKDLAE